MTLLRFTLPLIFLVAASSAQAHTGVGAHASFLDGFLHPLGGLDHVLAMTAVGLWAGLIGGRAVKVLPAAFLAAMLAGGTIGFAGVVLPWAELTITASVIVLWGAIILRLRPSALVGGGLSAVFALAHGYAHGAEMVPGSDAWHYAAGFLVATSLLVLAGLAVAWLARGLVRHTA